MNIDNPGGSAPGALIYKGSIDCSGNPNFPAATQGDVYRISVSGKIGGAAGDNVLAGDDIICNTTAVAGTKAEVGTSWDIFYNGSAGEELSKTTANSSNFYVDVTTGSDTTGDGSYTNPFATVNKAISTIPDNVHHSCLVTLAAGTYTENINLSKLGGYGVVKFRGSKNYLTPSTKTASDGSNTTIVKPVADAAMTPSEYAGKFVIIYGGAGYVSSSSWDADKNWHLIIDNDETTLTLQYNSTAFSGTTQYRILESSTILTGASTAAFIVSPDCNSLSTVIEGMAFSDARGHLAAYSGQTYINGCTFTNSGAGTNGYAVYTGTNNTYNISPRGTLSMRACSISGKYTYAVQSQGNAYVYFDQCYFNGSDKASSAVGLKVVGCPDANMTNTRLKSFARAVNINYSNFQSITGAGNIIDDCDYDFYSEGLSYMSLVAATIPTITNITYGSVSKDYSRIDKSSTMGNGYALDSVNEATSKIYYSDVKNISGRYTPEIWRTAAVSSAAGTTNLFTVPAGRTCIVYGAIIRMTADSSSSGNLVGSIDNGASVIFSSQTFTALSLTTTFQILPAGNSAVAAAGETISLTIGTSHASGSSTLEVQLSYQLI